MDNPASRIDQLSAIVTERIGLHYPDIRRQDLERGLAAAAKSLGFASMDKCLEWLLEAPFDDTRMTALVNHLTIGETYFFRHPETFMALEQQALPGLVDARRKGAGGSKRLSVWCAACSSGEEAYSIAIMLQRMIPDFESWDISIVATDINQQCLRKAAKGEYGAWSFRGVSADDKQRYFDETSAGWSVKPAIRKSVRFEYLNLADTVMPPSVLGLVPVDVIFCRNVLIYLSPAHIRRLMNVFSGMLAQDGWLVTSPVETGYARDTELSLKNFGHATLLHARRASEPTAGTAHQWQHPLQSMPHGSIAFTEKSPSDHRSNDQMDRPIHGPLTHNPLPLFSARPSGAHSEGASARPSGAHSEGAQAGQTGAGHVKAEIDPIAQAERLHADRRYADALETLLGASAGSRPVERSILLARIYADLGNLEEAQFWCKKAVDADTVRPEPYYLLATIQMAAGENGPAMESLRRVVFLAPDFAMAHYSMALLLRRLKRQADSERHLQIVSGLLTKMPPDEVVAGSEGMSARSMIDMVASLQQRGR